MNWKRKYRWESYPEYIALQQYGRCLGAVLASAPPRLRRRASKTLVRGAVLMSTSIACAHAECDADWQLDAADREAFRVNGLECVALSRQGLLALRHKVSRPHLTAALELLERVESGLRERPLPGA